MPLEILVVAALSLLAEAAPEKPPDLVDVAGYDTRFVIDIRYATADNFFGKAVYPEARCILLRVVAERVVRAQRYLDERHPGLRLSFKDCYRPDHVQQVLWDAVKGTERARYVANPSTPTGSIHAYAAAVDVTLADASGAELDMGTPYDHLGPLAEPRHEPRFLREGRLTEAHVRSRRILRAAMRSAGFVGLRNEWWHFNAAPAKVVRARFRRLDIPFRAVPYPDSPAPRSDRPAGRPAKESPSSGSP